MPNDFMTELRKKFVKEIKCPQCNRILTLYFRANDIHPNVYECKYCGNKYNCENDKVYKPKLEPYPTNLHVEVIKRVVFSLSYFSSVESLEIGMMFAPRQELKADFEVLRGSVVLSIDPLEGEEVNIDDFKDFDFGSDYFVVSFSNGKIIRVKGSEYEAS